ncbi:bifunctional aspartate transaminase/aspartate 4-decarboxylase [Halodesulfovibrio spirochaetisodalis]|uniref:Aminotransferase n=1 Tax=Halodesulfovibrio spirochaetisodalis TaxID=1560234 RepID=A0A1B7XAT5_9BACT|nr:bifunctional aspartate transaminase/aspartate 4-decarboxylase [Halodesulfovibrio spirochaetisodalis]OBQ46482.1 aspartate aminotransferase [Halodesulfovibrio spirochaetisodalis]
MDRRKEKELEKLSPFEVKNTLISYAEDSHDHAFINAGRGNPNWVATLPRAAFFELGSFALLESKRTLTHLPGFGGLGEKKGVATRFKAFCTEHAASEGVQFLEQALEFLTQKKQFDAETLLHEWVEGILGDNYPVPDRMLECSEKIVHEYLMQEMCAGDFPLPEGSFDLFAVEGGTAAMFYVFNSLKSNRMLNKGDTIAIGSPIFTPYIEMPELEDYALKKIEVMEDEKMAWSIPDSELKKLRDPKVKAFFLVNPSNPTSMKLDDSTLRTIASIAQDRHDLIILTDDVYGTFADNFTSLAMLAPHNTILVYSFSKYFGATGWRLGVIGIHKENMFDQHIASVSDELKDTFRIRYGGISLDPDSLKFIDRIVADSRAVALNHTAGLSTPQQIQMTLFALLSLMKGGDEYKQRAKHIVRKRYHALLKHSEGREIVSEHDANGAFYYVEIDIQKIAMETHGKDFFDWLKKKYEPIDLLIKLARDNGVVVMPGAGFDAPDWSLRISLANQSDKQCEIIMDAIEAHINSYYEVFFTK